MTGHDSNEPGHHTGPTPLTDGRRLTPTDDQPTTGETGGQPMTATPSSHVPDTHERARLNTAFAATAAETGFWDDDGSPAPWPDDIEDWTLETHQTDPQKPNDF